MQLALVNKLGSSQDGELRAHTANSPQARAHTDERVKIYDIKMTDSIRFAPSESVLSGERKCECAEQDDFDFLKMLLSRSRKEPKVLPGCCSLTTQPAWGCSACPGLLPGFTWDYTRLKSSRCFPCDRVRPPISKGAQLTMSKTK